MATGPPTDDHALVERAIARVLEAERAARIAIVDAQGQAVAGADRARATALAIGVRTERRIVEIRARFEQRIAAEVAALDRVAATLNVDCGFGEADRSALGRAVETLAAELTGGRA